MTLNFLIRSTMKLMTEKGFEGKKMASILVIYLWRIHLKMYSGQMGMQFGNPGDSHCLGDLELGVFSEDTETVGKDELAQ